MADQPIEQPVDATEVDDQHAADEAVQKPEPPRVLAVEMIVFARHWAEGKGGQRPAGRLVDAVVVHAQRRLAAARSRELRHQRAGEADVDAAAQPGLAVLLVVGGDRAVRREHVVGDLEVVAIADEHAAHRLDGARAVLVDMVAGDHHRLDDRQRDAAAADELRLGAHGIVERVAQIVMDAVVEDHQVAYRIGRAQERRQREIEDRRVDIGEQRTLRVVGRNVRRHPGHRRAIAQRETDARQPHHRDVVVFDRDLMQETTTQRCRRARADRHCVDEHAFVARLGDLNDAVRRRDIERVRAGRRLDAHHALRVAAVRGGGRAFEIEVDVCHGPALLVLHEGKELPVRR